MGDDTAAALHRVETHLLMMRTVTAPGRVTLNGQASKLWQPRHSVIKVHICHCWTPVQPQHLQLLQAPLLWVASTAELLGPASQIATHCQALSLSMGGRPSSCTAPGLNPARHPRSMQYSSCLQCAAHENVASCIESAVASREAFQQQMLRRYPKYTASSTTHHKLSTRRMYIRILSGPRVVHLVFEQALSPRQVQLCQAIQLLQLIQQASSSGLVMEPHAQR